jgi:uncharacterized protein (TIGR03437 family)
VLFAGLAPGLIGIYQVDLRIPSPAPQDSSLYTEIGMFADIPVAR